jgi:hypothetical protein
MILVFGFVLFVIRSTRVELVTLRPQSNCGDKARAVPKKSHNPQSSASQLFVKLLM